MSEAYPRDMIGYGRTPPFADWPGGARVALQFVINYEEGGENNILHGDAASEAFLSEIVGAAPWPGMRHMNMELIYEYGSRAGFWRLHRMFTERDVPVTVYAVATAMARNPQAVDGDERGGLGDRHPRLQMDRLSRHAARDRARSTSPRRSASTPRSPASGRSASTRAASSINTIPLGCEEGGFLYCADAYADDLPYYIEGPRGRSSSCPIRSTPTTCASPTPQGFNSGDQFYAYLKDAFDMLYAEGATAPKMLSIGLHCRLVGRPGARRLARALPRLRARPRQGVDRDPARHRAPLDRQAPAAGGWKPSRLTRTLFVERFGGVYEHSRWVAEAAYDAGLSARRTAPKVSPRRWRAPPRRAATAQKRALIAAHPDLAGRLALAKRLTAGVDARAGGAGLDRLTPDELERFTDAQRRLSRQVRLPLHHGGQGQDQGRDSRRVRGAAEERRGEPNSRRRWPRSTASPRCGSKEILP